MTNNEGRGKGKKLKLRNLTYERFTKTTDRFTIAMLLRAKRQFPTAMDPAFAEDLMLRGVLVNMHEPPDGPTKEALDVFDMSYKLGLPIAGTLATILRRLTRAWWHKKTHQPTRSRKIVLKRWKSIPLPLLDHIELHEDGELVTRRYLKGKGISDVAAKTSRLYGSYEGNLLASPSLYHLWHYLISVYAARKLEILLEQYEDGSHPLALQEAMLDDIAEEVEVTNPVGKKGPPEKKMTHYLTQKNLAELFVMLERLGYIDQASAAVLKRAFHRTDSIQKYLKPGSGPRDTKRHYFDLFTPDFVPLFDKLPPNPKKTTD